MRLYFIASPRPALHQLRTLSLGLGVPHIVKACGSGSGVQTKTFIVDFASADDAKWEALLEELKPIEVGVLGA